MFVDIDALHFSAVLLFVCQSAGCDIPEMWLGLYRVWKRDMKQFIEPSVICQLLFCVVLCCAYLCKFLWG